MRGSIYFGHQGSEVQASGTAGGNVYGGSIAYYPTPLWTITGAIDETINVSSETFTTQALAIPVQAPLQIPLGASTHITSTSLQTTYTISRQWTTSGSLSQTRVKYFDGSRLDNAWTADATLSYEIWRNMTLAWEYQYSTIISNVPLTSSKRNYFNMGVNYRF